MLRRDQECSADVPCAVKFHPDWGDPAPPADALRLLAQPRFFAVENAVFRRDQ